jgi:allophanate hydrolase subunit 2
LRRGDRICAGANATADAITRANVDGIVHADGDVDAIEIALGPDLVEGFRGGTFTIGAASDRMGTRLEGPAPPDESVHSARERRSTPMVPGAIELTPSGLIVLGPDHPTTGGYPVIGVVRSHALGALFSRPIGSRVRLVA